MVLATSLAALIEGILGRRLVFVTLHILIGFIHKFILEYFCGCNEPQESNTCRFSPFGLLNLACRKPRNRVSLSGRVNWTLFHFFPFRLWYRLIDSTSPQAMMAMCFSYSASMFTDTWRQSITIIIAYLLEL